jgi:hypothetical protein
MLDKESTAKALHNLINRKRVVAMDDMFRALDTQCRMSIFRRLKEIGYRTSYTHCGRYYTLESILGVLRDSFSQLMANKTIPGGILHCLF